MPFLFTLRLSYLEGPCIHRWPPFECYNFEDLNRCAAILFFTADFLFVGTWLSLVEHSLGVRGVGSSNLPVPTILLIRIIFTAGSSLHSYQNFLAIVVLIESSA
jgi:hypothetical protein